MNLIGLYILFSFFLGYVNRICTIANVSFSRMRKNYIDDNEELDSDMVQKVKPFYDKASEVLMSLNLFTLLISIAYGYVLLQIVILSKEVLVIAGYNGISWILNVGQVTFYLCMLVIFWVFSIEFASAKALVNPLGCLISVIWFIKYISTVFNPITTACLLLLKQMYANNGQPFHNRIDFTYSEDEIRSIVEESHSGGQLNTTENKLLKNSFDFFDLLVKDVMIPRNQMIVLEYEDSMEEQRKCIAKSPHTRYPVCMNDKDHILGFVHVKDFMESYLQHENNVKKIIRELLVVPEVMSVSSLTQRMRSRRVYIAVVVDEYGGTVGLVTLEDLVEGLVGEIPADFGIGLHEIVKHTDGSYEFEGMVILDDISDCLGINFKNESSANTIGGYVFSILERIPSVGDSIQIENWKFTVIRMDGLRIRRVKATYIATHIEVETLDETIATEQDTK